MENYKEKYEQALENLKKIKTANMNNKELVDFIEYQYPELKESENESWIPKEITKYLKGKGDFRSCWLVWLEKQGEQKPDKIVEKAKTEKQRVLLTETDGTANIDWDCRSLDDVKILLKCGLEFIRTIEANKQILTDTRFGGCSLYVPTRYHKEIKQGEQKPVNYSVWVGGSEVNDNYLTKEEAEKLAGKYRKDGYEDVAIEKIEQKPAWSENDELNFNQAIYVCHQHGYLGVETWLKSLKKRMKGE